MRWRKHQRYVFRKRSRWGRILWLVVGGLMVVGLVWSVPWPTLSWVDLDDAPKSDASQNQPEQASAEDQPEQDDNEGSTEDRPEQGSTGEQSKEEKAPEATHFKEEVASNDLSSSSTPPAQVSPPPQAPSPTPRVQQVQMTSLSPNDYWYPEPDYRYSEPGYWDYSWDYYGSDNYYWDY